MNIIFKENLDQQFEKYTVLDLDTFQLPDGTKHTACCVVENVPIHELGMLGNLKELHSGLIKNYGEKNWEYCEQALEQLIGKWGGEVDSFYAEIKKRISNLKTKDLPDTWTPIIVKTN